MHAEGFSDGLIYSVSVASEQSHCSWQSAYKSCS